MWVIGMEGKGPRKLSLQPSDGVGGQKPSEHTVLFP